MVYRGGLENRCTVRYPGFESRPLRLIGKKQIKRHKGGVAFRKLLSDFNKRGVSSAELAEVSRLRRDRMSSCSPANGEIPRVSFGSSSGLSLRI